MYYNKKLIIKYYSKSKHLQELSQKTNISEYRLVKILPKLGLDILLTKSKYDIKIVQDKIIEDLKDRKLTYKEIAKKHNFSETYIKNLSLNKKLNRNTKYSISTLETIYKSIISDINANVTYNEIYHKYNLNNNLNDAFKRYGFPNIRKICLNKRNDTINKEYLTKTAKNIINSEEPITLFSPNNVTNIGSIYKNVTYRKYPKIGRRDLGGTFLDKKILRYILDKRNNKKYSFSKISDKLNKLGYKTSMEKEFTSHSVRYYYNSYNKKKYKRIKF